MNFSNLLSEEEKKLAELSFLAAKSLIAPTAEKDDEEGIFRPEIIRELGKLGLTGVATPSEYDGADLGYKSYCIAMEQIGYFSPSYSISIGVSGLPQVILNQFGTPEQKKKYVPPLARGEHIGAFSLSESFSGSDASSLKTRAIKDGKHYVINGTKLWATQSNIAETTILFARTGDEGPRGITAFLLEKGMKGFKTGKVEKKMGLNASPTAEIILEDVRVPESHIVGNLGEGFKIAMTALDSGRITIGATAVGVARAALEYSNQYARNRTQFGKPISDFQGIQFMLADMYTLLEASRLLVHQAATLKDQKLPFTREAAAAKLFATDSAMKITTDAVQILGGNGYVKDYPVERYMRDAKVLQIVEGTNQIQRLVIGRSLEQWV